MQRIGAVLPVPRGRSEDREAKGRIEIEKGKRERTIGTSETNGFTENASSLSSSVILVANVSEKSILLPC